MTGRAEAAVVAALAAAATGALVSPSVADWAGVWVIPWAFVFGLMFAAPCAVTLALADILLATWRLDDLAWHVLAGLFLGGAAALWVSPGSEAIDRLSEPAALPPIVGGLFGGMAFSWMRRRADA